MMQKLLWFLGLLGFLAMASPTAALAQRTLSGRVTDADTGEGLPGVSVLVKGTTTGTVTDLTGNYSLSVADNAVLVFQTIGYVTQEIILGTQATLDVALQPDVKALSEVVVTSLAIEKQKREITYGVQTVNASQLAQKSEPNALNALQGKLSGVEIISGSGLAGSRTQIFIRGLSSATGNNQPLFVIDGIPMDNSSFATSGTLVGGAAYSNRALDLNPNDIESMTVLKGPAAAALYGSRAANGAIMITTKKGAFNKKMEITVTSSYNIQELNRRSLPKYQNEFGQGTVGYYNSNILDSWGPRFANPLMPGQVPNASPQTTPTALGLNGRPTTFAWQAQPNNVYDAFRVGSIFDNGVSISGGGQKTRYVMAFNTTSQDGIIPNSTLNRYSIRVGGSAELSNDFTIDASLTYTLTRQGGVQQGNSGASPWFVLPFIPRGYDLNATPAADPSIPGVQTQSLFTNSNRDNPYWAFNNNTYESDVNRVLLTSTLTYNPKWLKGLSVSYRAGLDQYTDRRLEVIGFGGRPGNSNWATSFRGANYFDNYFYRQFNQDFFARYNRKLTDDFNLQVLVGTQWNEIQLNNTGTLARDMIVPGFNNLANFSNATMFPFNSLSKQRLIGSYATATLTYKNWATLELQGRNDWSSTLPPSKRSYFYYAVSGGFIFTDAFKIGNKILSYGKIRANYAQVGNAAGPYLISTVAAFAGATNYGNNVAGIDFPFLGTNPGTTLGNRIGGGEQLAPEFKRSTELGAELNFLDGRITLDVNYFRTSQTSQIFTNLPVTASTGFTSRTANAGEITNRGWELALSANVFNTKSGFRWDVDLNWTRIRNKVESLADGVNQIVLSGFATFGGGVVPGQPYGVFIGRRVVRDDRGRALINPATGLPIVTNADQVIGDPNPDWWAGLTNSFSYKGFRLGIVLQYVSGGDVISRQTQIARLRGILPETGDRDRPYMFNGIYGNPNTLQAVTDASGNAIPNSTQISVYDYFTAGLQGAEEFAVFDATVFRLRELSLGYDLPKSLLNKTPFGAVNITFTGRNLFFYAPNMPHADPENNLQGGNSRGFEFNNAPTARNYGVNLRFTF